MAAGTEEPNMYMYMYIFVHTTTSTHTARDSFKLTKGRDKWPRQNEVESVSVAWLGTLRTN